MREKNSLRQYTSVIRIRFLNGMQYRAAAAAGIFTQFAWGLMLLTLYAAFYRADPNAFPMEREALASYVWLQQGFLTLFIAYSVDPDIIELITTGNVAYELCRPTSLYGLWFCKTMGGRLARATLRCLPIFLLAPLLPKPYGLSLPANPAAFLLFLLAMVLALVCVTSYVMLIYVLTFRTISPLGLRAISIALSEFFTGSLIPLPFLPNGFRQFAELLPYASMQNIPFRIYSGDLAGTDALWAVALQCFWVAVMLTVGVVGMRRVLKRAVVQGG